MSAPLLGCGLVEIERRARSGCDSIAQLADDEVATSFAKTLLAANDPDVGDFDRVGGVAALTAYLRSLAAGAAPPPAPQRDTSKHLEARRNLLRHAQRLGVQLDLQADLQDTAKSVEIARGLLAVDADLRAEFGEPSDTHSVECFAAYLRSEFAAGAAV